MTPNFSDKIDSDIQHRLWRDILNAAAFKRRSGQDTSADAADEQDTTKFSVKNNYVAKDPAVAMLKIDEKIHKNNPHQYAYKLQWPDYPIAFQPRSASRVSLT